jgi:hypothetical protein
MLALSLRPQRPLRGLCRNVSSSSLAGSRRGECVVLTLHIILDIRFREGDLSVARLLEASRTPSSRRIHFWQS